MQDETCLSYLRAQIYTDMSAARLECPTGLYRNWQNLLAQSGFHIEPASLFEEGTHGSYPEWLAKTSYCPHEAVLIQQPVDDLDEESKVHRRTTCRLQLTAHNRVSTLAVISLLLSGAKWMPNTAICGRPFLLARTVVVACTKKLATWPKLLLDHGYDVEELNEWNCGIVYKDEFRMRIDSGAIDRHAPPTTGFLWLHDFDLSQERHFWRRHWAREREIEKEAMGLLGQFGDIVELDLEAKDD